MLHSIVKLLKKAMLFLKIPRTKANDQFTTVRSNLEYCSAVWNPNIKDQVDRCRCPISGHDRAGQSYRFHCHCYAPVICIPGSLGVGYSGDLAGPKCRDLTVVP